MAQKWHNGIDNGIKNHNQCEDWITNSSKYYQSSSYDRNITSPDIFNLLPKMYKSGSMLYWYSARVKISQHSKSVEKVARRGECFKNYSNL